MDNNIYNSDELTHWGILGMKWGVRRYQNKDGSLTAAGKKRRAKLEAELDNLNKIPRKKTVGEMTDDELREKTNRMQLESSYYNAKKNLATVNPRKESGLEKFTNSLLKDVIAPAATNAGKAWLEKFMKDKLGLNDKDPLERLKYKYETLDYKKKIKDLKKGDDDDLDALIDKLADMSPERYDRLKTAAGIKYYQEGLRNKGIKPDKDKDKNKKKDDDDDDD